LKKLNPALKRVIWKHKSLVPKGFPLKLPYRSEGWKEAVASIYSLPAEKEKPGFIWHRVRSGQTACGIAEKYKASCAGLIRLNKLDRKGTIYVGRRIKVPSKSGGITVAGRNKKGAVASVVPDLAVSDTAPEKAESMRRYRVRKGDTACSIANRFGMKCNELLAMNGLSRNSLIQIGQRLTVTAESSWHKVRGGQTACGIAESYRVKCGSLLEANSLSLKDTIRVGQRLRIPAKR